MGRIKQQLAAKQFKVPYVDDSAYAWSQMYSLCCTPVPLQLSLEVVGATLSFAELMRRDFWGLPMHGSDALSIGYGTVWRFQLVYKVWLDQQVLPTADNTYLPLLGLKSKDDVLTISCCVVCGT